MFWFKKLDRHTGLMRRMGAALGVDFGQKMQDGKLRPEDYRAAVLNCSCCDSTEACEHWMEEHEEGAEAAPPYCRNARLLAALKE